MKNDRFYLKCITAGRAAEGLRADWQEQLRTVQDEIGFEYIRFHGIFHDDMAIYDVDENDKPKFFFGYFDKLFDFLLSVGLKPIFELGFMPEKLKGNDGTLFWWKAHTCPPSDYDKWALLVSETIKHAIDRYGLDEVKTWYFEVWNEPNLGSFWHGTQEEYFKLYTYSVGAIKSIDKSLRVGGPSTSGADFRECLCYLKEFIVFCDKNSLPIDFFTAHPYPTCWALDGDGVEHMGYISKDVCSTFLDNIRSIVDDSPYSNAEIHLTEWNSSPSPRDLIHDTPFMAPFILYNISQNFGKVNSLGFWTFTDIFEENGPGETEFHGGFGLISHNGIKKPAYYAYQFLSQLGDEIVEVTENKIVSRTSDDHTVIIWNYCYYKADFAGGNREALTLTNRDDVFQNKNISNDLFGIFLEDINFACDGGLNANKVNNYSFDGVYMNPKARTSKPDYLRYWNVENGQLLSGDDKPLSQNSRYAVVRTAGGKASFSNKGYNGGKDFKDISAISVKMNKKYIFSAYVRNVSLDGKVFVSVVDDDGVLRTERVGFEINNTEWEKIEFTVKGTDTGYGMLKIEAEGNGIFHIDCIIFRDKEVWGEDDSKWCHGKFRKDLVEALKALHPKFMRFPGGCIVEGYINDNEYNWKDTVGELYERKSKYNLWSEALPDLGYNQSYQIGFYEYFCLCEDLGMKPLPTLWAGLNCQIRAKHRSEPTPEIDVDSPEFKTRVIDMYLDLIDFANGTDESNKWVALRIKMGHKEPFGLDRIGVGNENWGESYYRNFEKIKTAIHEKAPEIKLVFSCEANPEKEIVEPIWEYVRANHNDIIVDEHSYRTPEWFISEENRFDNYERGSAKVYMGEYAANNFVQPRKRLWKNGNYFESAIAEAAFLCGLERNGDVVEMSSYAPLFNLVEGSQWRHDLIDFNQAYVCPTANYMVQRIFASSDGVAYIPLDCEKCENVFVSCVENKAGKMFLRIININNEKLTITAQTSDNAQSIICETIYSPEGIYNKNRIAFEGKPDINIEDVRTEIEHTAGRFEITVPAQSINVFEIE